MSARFNRRRFIAAAGAAGLAGLAGCTGGEEPAEEPEGEQPAVTQVSWHAGGTGGTYYPLSNEVKAVVEGVSDYTVQVQSTGASVENVGSLAAGEADFALIQNDVGYFAKTGTGIDAFDGNPVESLMGVATLYPETITIVTLADTGITSTDDLEGAVINTGDLGSGTQVNATQILEALGISDYDEQNAGFSTAADQLRNGDIDAAFVVGGGPSARSPTWRRPTTWCSSRSPGMPRTRSWMRPRSMRPTPSLRGPTAVSTAIPPRCRCRR
jgi:TRAP transporter solute receptor, TAXI family